MSAGNNDSAVSGIGCGNSCCIYDYSLLEGYFFHDDILDYRSSFVAVDVCDHKCLLHGINYLLGYDLGHLNKSFSDAYALASLSNFALNGAAYGLDVEGGGNDGLHSCKTSVLSEGLKRVQNEIGIHAVSVGFQFLYNLIKGHPCIGQFHGLKGNLSLAAAGAQRVDYMNILGAVLLMIQALAKKSTVLAAA